MQTEKKIDAAAVLRAALTVTRKELHDYVSAEAHNEGTVLAVEKADKALAATAHVADGREYGQLTATEIGMLVSEHFKGTGADMMDAQRWIGFVRAIEDAAPISEASAAGCHHQFSFNPEERHAECDLCGAPYVDVDADAVAQQDAKAKQAGCLSEVEQLRHDQAVAVMPLIGPLLDAFEGAQRCDLEDVSTGLVRYLRAINSAMEGNISAASSSEASADRDSEMAALRASLAARTPAIVGSIGNDEKFQRLAHDYRIYATDGAFTALADYIDTIIQGASK